VGVLRDRTESRGRWWSAGTCQRGGLEVRTRNPGTGILCSQCYLARGASADAESGANDGLAFGETSADGVSYRVGAGRSCGTTRGGLDDHSVSRTTLAQLGAAGRDPRRVARSPEGTRRTNDRVRGAHGPRLTDARATGRGSSMGHGSRRRSVAETYPPAMLELAAPLPPLVLLCVLHKKLGWGEARARAGEGVAPSACTEDRVRRLLGSVAAKRALILCHTLTIQGREYRQCLPAPTA